MNFIFRKLHIVKPASLLAGMLALMSLFSRQFIIEKSRYGTSRNFTLNHLCEGLKYSFKYEKYQYAYYVILFICILGFVDAFCGFSDGILVAFSVIILLYLIAFILIVFTKFNDQYQDIYYMIGFGLVEAVLSELCLLATFVYRVPTKKQKKESKEERKNQKKEQEKKKESENIELLKKYKELLDIGALTQEEFDEKKNQILSKK